MNPLVAGIVLTALSIFMIVKTKSIYWAIGILIGLGLLAYVWNFSGEQTV